MRGFETFLGYWHWGEDYFTHVYPPAYKGPAKCRGIDFNNCSGARVASVGHGADGKYSANVFVDEFRRVVRNHPKEQPLYVYLAFQNAHGKSAGCGGGVRDWDRIWMEARPSGDS